MANEDKFSKTIDDEQLDEVAGGTRAETQKDIKFLNAIGAKLDKNASEEQVQTAWEELGVEVLAVSKDDNKSVKNTTYSDGNAYVTRQDAMIEAMRNAKKFVDLDEYL